MKAITEAKFLTDDERVRLLASLDKHSMDRDALLLQFVLMTGARSCEALEVKPTDFAWKDNTVTLRGAKGSDNRTLPLPAAFCRRMAEYVATVSGDRVFPITTRRLRYIWDVYRPNPNKGIHCLRHTAGVLLYLNCRDINVVRAYLGHRSIANTMVYLNFVEGPRKLKSAMKGMWGQKVLE